MALKQVIILRKDLNMRKGKMCAMAAHSSLKAVQQAPAIPTQVWEMTGHKKIVVGVNDLIELMTVYNAAKARMLPCSIILDEGLTEFHNIPTYTAVAIGPCDEDEVNKITGQLPLL